MAAGWVGVAAAAVAAKATGTEGDNHLCLLLQRLTQRLAE